jgi:hypothetical protein
VCVCGVGEAMSCGNCKGEVMRCAVCQTRARGMWLIDSQTGAWPDRRRLFATCTIGQRIDQRTNQTTTPTTSSKKCDTTRSAACVVPVTRK